MMSFAKAKYAFTGMDAGDLRFDKDEVLLITKKEGGWWWGMKEYEGAEADQASRAARIMTPSDQGRFPKNYVTEIGQEEYLERKKVQDETRQKRKQEEVEKRKRQEEVWTQKMEKIREEEEKRKRQERSHLKLQKVFGSESDILLSPRSRKEERLDVLLSPRHRDKNEAIETEKSEPRGGGEGATKSKTSSGDNRELKSSVDKRATAFEVVREERAHSAELGQSLSLPTHTKSSPLSTQSQSSTATGSVQSTDEALTRKWLKKKKALPRSLGMLANDYRERNKSNKSDPAGAEEDNGDEVARSRRTSSEGDGSVDTNSSGAGQSTGSDTNSTDGDDASGGEDDEDDGQVKERGEVTLSRRRQVSASTMFMNDMNYLAPELAKRADDARNKRRVGRNAISLDRA